MLLCINANNTNVKFAVYDGEKPVGDWRLKTEAGRTADQYVVWLNQLMIMAGLDFKKITGAIIASVVPQAVFHLTMLCEQHLKTKPLVVGDPAVKLGIQVKMDIPVSTVGADRLANAVGGHITYKKPLVIVDFGTATTFDVADGEGNYLGGAISPGINLSVEILHSATAMLPRIAVERPNRVIGKSTTEAMQSGIFWGYVGLVEGMVQRITAEFGADLAVIATGGLAPLFVGVTPLIHHLDPEITMRGLVEIYRRNKN
ncbi:type III pantothenate kinase [Dongia sedimenti]|uniref:Type III pantothenate kinase n=1 Tax=Dongia sedimenti TaxID=3064282 RepID=A0ABU0YK57_9PROT|nr:type III pantothenate kinase [Rhodospirillaceae bacterium R-7]